ncbi:succinate dehydrogenase cytochrome b subunit [Synechococcus elongatus]|uniref:Succinate dehydrogenase cytochrome b subunit n=1 Tax=Synechococcus elongatus PCC 11801 TaxID=2219813 RepID=A0AAN1QLY0_SYNEL|nr:succinate dehydrogenase cytochrome b subunit [Synechococcus elongatus]
MVLKLAAALSGLVLILFVGFHLATNLLLWRGADALDRAAIALHNQLWLPVAEVIVLGAIAVHFLTVLMLAWRNRQARGTQAYAQWQSKQTSWLQWAATSTVFSGSGLALFLMLHLRHFRWTPHDPGDTAALVIQTLHKPMLAIAYGLGATFLALHLSHGLRSLVRSLGLFYPKWAGVGQRLAIAIAIGLGLGFSSLSVLAIGLP